MSIISRSLSEAVIALREERLIQACEAANAHPDVRAIENEWESLRDDIAEPTSETPVR
jgi:hypothetical protein